jgi:hypothetical protein
MARIDATLEKTLYDWISAQTGITTIWDKQKNITRPALPFATVSWLDGGTLEGMVDTQYKTLDTVEHVFRNVAFVSVNIYAEDNHLGLMNDLKNSLQFESVKSDMRQGGLRYRTYGATVDLSAIVDTSYELRSQCDFSFAYSAAYDEVVGEIHSVSGTIDLNFEGEKIEELDVDVNIN